MPMVIVLMAKVMLLLVAVILIADATGDFDGRVSD